MLRFSKFTIGWAWESDYGSVDNREEFFNLLSYSFLLKGNLDLFPFFKVK